MCGFMLPPVLPRGPISPQNPCSEEVVRIPYAPLRVRQPCANPHSSISQVCQECRECSWRGCTGGCRPKSAAPGPPDRSPPWLPPREAPRGHDFRNQPDGEVGYFPTRKYCLNWCQGRAERLEPAGARALRTTWRGMNCGSLRPADGARRNLPRPGEAVSARSPQRLRRR